MDRPRAPSAREDGGGGRWRRQRTRSTPIPQPSAAGSRGPSVLRRRQTAAVDRWPPCEAAVAHLMLRVLCVAAPRRALRFGTRGGGAVRKALNIKEPMGPRRPAGRPSLARSPPHAAGASLTRRRRGGRGGRRAPPGPRAPRDPRTRRAPPALVASRPTVTRRSSARGGTGADRHAGSRVRAQTPDGPRGERLV